ncbi:kinase-like domain-containing protein [Jimgerdemannia flammicorona]|uniref:Kinase-like domain-containing protein n=1 Tax=Jimgerdemannia flammicorona TaxID=994334 RepID=A0A433DGH0_9FUNG|nr:kinase-like domain-containing protein [Jimgerdemannia flammicorona]
MAQTKRSEWLDMALAKHYIPEIAFRDLTPKYEIGRGASGQVEHMAWHIGTSEEQVAVKKIYNGKQEDIDKTFVKELQHIVGLSHDRIVRFYGISYNEVSNAYVFVHKFYENGTLRNYLQKNPQIILKQRVSIANEVALGLNFIHYRGVVHRDLNTGNVLVDAQGHCVIADFGIAKAIDEATSTFSVVGSNTGHDPQRLLSPFRVQDIRLKQLRIHFRYSLKHTIPGDIYSFGVVCWEIFKGRKPFENRPHGMDLALEIIDGLREEPVPGLPQRYIDLYTTCWDNNLKNRPAMEVILNRLAPV